MGGMQDKFEAELRATFEANDQYRNVVEQIKKQARQDPEGLAVRIAAAVPHQMKQWREQAAELFSVDVADRGSVKGFKPRTISEAQVFCHLADRWQVFRECLLQIEMYIKDPSLVGRPFAEKVCEAGLEATKKVPALTANHFRVFRRRLSELGASEELLNDLRDQEAKFLAGYLATQISLKKNVSVAKAMDDRHERSPEKSAKRERFETLLQVLYVEAPEVWDKRYKTDIQLLSTRTAVTKKIGARNETPPKKAEMLELARFADRETLLKRGRDVGLPPREYELYKLFVENTNIKYCEAAAKLGISVGAVGKMKSNINKTLAEAG